MQDFFLKFPIPKAEKNIQHGESLLFIGSCFSDEIAQKARFYGLSVLSNPYGVLFNPISIGAFLNDVLEQNNEYFIFQRNDYYLSWKATSTLSAKTKEALQEKMNDIQLSWRSALKDAHYLFITFGTAWIYQLKESREVVANCHKQSSEFFNKTLSSVDQIVSHWKTIVAKLKAFNPNMNIVFTVSPVRHIKDGLIENNRSKAILLEAVHQLCEQLSLQYFPSYEIVMDELRDYRFFKSDFVHPNKEAVNYIWDRFTFVYFNSKTKELNSKINQLRLSEQHRYLFTDSQEAIKHANQTKIKKEELLLNNPNIVW